MRQWELALIGTLLNRVYVRFAQVLRQRRGSDVRLGGSYGYRGQYDHLPRRHAQRADAGAFSPSCLVPSHYRAVTLSFSLPPWNARSPLSRTARALCLSRALSLPLRVCGCVDVCVAGARVGCMCDSGVGGGARPPWADGCLGEPKIQAFCNVPASLNLFSFSLAQWSFCVAFSLACTVRIAEQHGTSLSLPPSLPLPLCVCVCVFVVYVCARVRARACVLPFRCDAGTSMTV